MRRQLPLSPVRHDLDCIWKYESKVGQRSRRDSASLLGEGWEPSSVTLFYMEIMETGNN